MRRAIAPERFGPENHLTTGDFASDASGWSRHGFATGSVDRTFTVEVDNQFRILVGNTGVGNRGDRMLSIDLLRPGSAAVRIAAFEERHRQISGAEYRRPFRDPE